MGIVKDSALRLPKPPPSGQSIGNNGWNSGWQFLRRFSYVRCFYLFLPFLLFLALVERKGTESSQWQQRLRWSVVKGLFISTIVLVLLIFPWTIRNQKAFGTFVLLNTNSGFAFFWGNHPIYATEVYSTLALSAILL